MKKAERQFQAKIRELGCIACIVAGRGPTFCEIHHILSGGRRMGEMFVLGLCAMCHRSGRNDEEIVSRHPFKREFEARYGTEQALLEDCKRRLA